MAAADALLDRRLAAPFTGDANDHLWQWEAARDYDPTPGLDRIRARVLAITSADDERNPPTLDLMAPAIARIPHARHLLVPPSAGTSGHGSLMDARFCADALAALLREAPRLA